MTSPDDAPPPGSNHAVISMTLARWKDGKPDIETFAIEVPHKHVARVFDVLQTAAEMMKAVIDAHDHEDHGAD